ncbi:hypothetical protein ACFL1X_13750 [Candidatus Hydrogenedentota bacterium]
MTQHDDSIRLRHMLDYSRKAVVMAQERTRKDLDSVTSISCGKR